MNSSYDLIIVGGGIVGLATAYKSLLANPGASLLLLEKENEIAAHQTGRNSGVIHSGIYYKPGSYKALNCRDGYRQLVAFCDENEVAYEICGKLIVATDESELPRLATLNERAEANGLQGVSRIAGEQIVDYEPHATGIAALHVPETGIIDYLGMCHALAKKIGERGGEIHLSEKVTGLAETSSGVTVQTDRGSYQARQICSCAGLHADRLARQTDPELDVRIIPFRGEYYEIAHEKTHLVKNLIYPVPDPAFPFLGVHFTRMVLGGVEAGPNAVLALAREGYTWGEIDLRDLAETFAWPGFWTLARKHWRMGSHEIVRSFSKKAFTHALQRLVPEIQEDDIAPIPAGVRAQACHRSGALLDDFQIVRHRRVLHVCNAPSPAATAALAIADHIQKELET